MTLYPDVQKKAQQEIDAVVGTDRLPSFDDRHNLPYVCALVSEVMRWQPIVPMGKCTYSAPATASFFNCYPAFRRLDGDITVAGYHLPKGSVILANMWHFLRDPETYPYPEVFRPERFLKTNDHEPIMPTKI